MFLADTCLLVSLKATRVSLACFLVGSSDFVILGLRPCVIYLCFGPFGLFRWVMVFVFWCLGLARLFKIIFRWKKKKKFNGVDFSLTLVDTEIHWTRPRGRGVGCCFFPAMDLFYFILLSCLFIVM